MYEIKLLDAAIKDLKKLDKTVAARILMKLKWLGAHIDEINLDSLTGEFSHLFKLRVGDYRVLFEVDHNSKEIIAHLAGHRSDIYEI